MFSSRQPIRCCSSVSRASDLYIRTTQVHLGGSFANGVPAHRANAKYWMGGPKTGNEIYLKVKKGQAILPGEELPPASRRKGRPAADCPSPQPLTNLPNRGRVSPTVD